MAGSPEPGEKWHRLVGALGALGADLNLADVLRRLVQAATTLVDARYGAIGVIDEHGQLVDFVFVGIEPELVEKIGHLPHGRGILGLLISEPLPLRLRDLGRHQAAYGFPDHHPPMHSFLGVPVRGRTGVLGNLYLTEKQGDEEFTAEDEELAVTFAASAAAAIENARLYEDSRRREQLVDAVREINADLLAGTSVDEVLGTVARRARELVGADTATVAIPAGDDRSLAVDVALGAHAAEIAGARFPLEGSVSGEVIRTGTTALIEDAAGDPRAYQPIVALGQFGPTMVVALSTPGGPFATLLLANRQGGRRFTPADVALVETFAGQASVALDYAASRAELERLTLVEDRERIARDLHDTVIQRLFATAMALQGAARLARTPEVEERLERAVDDLDSTIRDIRSTIFALESARRRGHGLRADVLALAGEAAGGLGFEPRVRFDGPVDAAVPQEVGGQMLATLQEALSNAARHAKASWVEVEVSAGDHLRLRVADDGVGLGEVGGQKGLGLRNMEERARSLGGTLEVHSLPGGGTSVTWRVPLRAGGGESSRESW